MFSKVEDFVNKWFRASYEFKDLFDMSSGDCVKPCLDISLDYAGSDTATFNVFNGATES